VDEVLLDCLGYCAATVVADQTWEKQNMALSSFLDASFPVLMLLSLQKKE
jgi:hypothetical protein